MIRAGIATPRTAKIGAPRPSVREKSIRKARVYEIDTVLNQEAVLPDLWRSARRYAGLEQGPVRKAQIWVERIGSTAKRGTK